MSLIENIALRRKMGKVGAQHAESFSDLFKSKHSENAFDEDQGHSAITVQQEEEVLDKILYGSRSKYSGGSNYNSRYEKPDNELNVDFIDRGNMVIRVMDKHNFYEAELMPDEYLTDAPVGLLTKLWIHISRVVRE